MRGVIMAEKKKKPYEIGELDQYLFGQGNHYEIYEKLGAHLVQNGKQKGVYFAVWAPHAQAVSVVGEFNEWDTEANPMKREEPLGIYTCFIPGVKKDQMYKYCIETYSGEQIFKADPYANYAELRPGTASRVTDIENIKWTDTEWMTRRKTWNHKHEPMSVYEAHIGSWMRHPGREDEGFYTYREFARAITKYIKEMGYTHVELMGIAEHPFDGSWGYQNTGFFAPTARYGTPDELKKFVDECHQAGIGVIMDFVPVHFAVDSYGLANYDGTALFEYPNSAVGVSEWGSCNFMHSRGEVRSFLQSAAAYWLAEYHFDGLRMDAVSNLIYWQGNEARGVNNLAVSFIQNMNEGLKDRFPTAMLLAEDSSSYQGVTKTVRDGGLGFDYKWDMGWMNDTLNYFRTAPEYRSRDYHKLTFSMMYYYNDVFLLPLSHDEVVHGKATIAQKMHGEYEEKFPQARAFYMYMYAHPGKKLNFMGNEIGQLREWDEKREQDWDILKYPIHDAFHHFMQKLNHLYMTTPALSAKDYENAGFQWLDCHQEERCIYAFERTDGKDRIVAVFNFSDEDQKGYELPIKDAKELEVILASDDVAFGGGKKYTKKKVKVTDGKAVLDLSAYSAVYFLIHDAF